VDNLHRQVFADGREFPATFEFPAYLGYSTGNWEGDTFVVESRGFNDRTPLDADWWRTTIQDYQSRGRLAGLVSLKHQGWERAGR
jgi:hypothetical protein